MVRSPRKRSKTGVYHVMLKGIDGRNIFLDDDDKTKFIEKMIRAKETGNFKIYSYCLMDNHVHLLIEESDEIGTCVKRITVGYVQWHNNKYGRTGHLFQNRYLSEPVETESYLITVIRYIHQNPLKAKMVKHPADYIWGSYIQYIDAYQGQKNLIDAQLVKSYFKRQEDFEGYMSAPNDDHCLKYKQIEKYSDADLKKFINDEFTINDFESLPKDAKNMIIREVYQKTGVSIRQLARVLGSGKNIIERAIKIAGMAR